VDPAHQPPVLAWDWSTTVGMTGVVDVFVTADVRV
jgi:hypothetical protein